MTSWQQLINPAGNHDNCSDIYREINDIPLMTQTRWNIRHVLFIMESYSKPVNLQTYLKCWSLCTELAFEVIKTLNSITNNIQQHWKFFLFCFGFFFSVHHLPENRSLILCIKQWRPVSYLMQQNKIKITQLWKVLYLPWCKFNYSSYCWLVLQ